MVNVDELAGWRREFQDLYELMDKSCEQFAAWSEEVAMIEGENQSVEFRRGMAEVKKDLRRYREVMRQLPKVEEFSDEEVEKRSGKASQSYWTSRGKLPRYNSRPAQGRETALLA